MQLNTGSETGLFSASGLARFGGGMLASCGTMACAAYKDLEFKVMV